MDFKKGLHKPAYTVIVSVYNSQDTLPELFDRIENTMSSLKVDYELLMIDDCSTDDTWDSLKTLKDSKEHIRLLRFTKNFGQAATQICGIQEAKADIMIMIDDDLQYPPEEIPKLIANFNPKKHYVLFGIPEKKQAKNFFEKVTSGWANTLINRIILQEKNTPPIYLSSFRIVTKISYNREAYNEKWMRNTQIFFKMVSRKYMDYIYIDHHPRKKGKSNYSFVKKLDILIDMVLVNSELPIRGFLVLSIFSLFTSVSVLLLFIFGFQFNDHDLIIPVLMILFTIQILGITITIKYLRPIFLKFLGVEPYAIWEEA